ncbi:MAG: hypothetical protein EB157_00670, partial [Euryarchaeota archaeon]|nr:hypothetical protein [Euryarchaeota archaeon]
MLRLVWSWRVYRVGSKKASVTPGGIDSRKDEREHSTERENGGFSELIFGSEKKMQKTKNTSMMIALLLVLMAGSVGVSADGSDPLDPSDGGADWDGDGLTNAEETAEGTDPTNPDTDNDGLPDGWEVAYGLNPNSASDANADPDGDGLTNSQEYASGTNPNAADTDGDGQLDADDPFPNDPNNGSMSDSDGDGIPDAYDPDYGD